MKSPLNREQTIDLLRAHDINLTQPRIDIACVLFSRMEHLSADQILAMVNERDFAVCVEGDCLQHAQGVA